MNYSDELKIEPEIQIIENENTELNIIQQEPDEIYKNYYIKCGEILVKNGEFLINCCYCDENFINYNYFSMHYNNFHETETTNQMIQKNTSNCTSLNREHKLEESFSQISLANNISFDTSSQKTIFEEDNDDDIEVIEIGECKFTVKKISSREDLTRLNNQNLEENSDINRRNIREYLSKFNSWERPFECQHCRKRFRQRDSLNVHIRSIHQKILPNQCEICKRRFFKSSALQIHIRDHTGERPFVCDICQKSFKSKGALNEHAFIHSDIKRFACQFCHKEFLHSSSLKKHERIHTGERPYICEQCQSSFRTLDLLKEHKRFHDDGKPFKCRLCNVGFSHRLQLTGHYRVHNGLEPKKKNRRSYKCGICEYKILTRKSNLRTHLRKSHGLSESQVEEMMMNLEEAPKLITNVPTFDNDEIKILSTI